MAVIFISHSSEDDELATRVADVLAENGFNSLFIDHGTSGIAPSEDWRATLTERLRQAEVLVYLGTAAAAKSTWCSAEIATAFAMGIPIRALQAEPNAQQPLLADIQWLRWSDDVAASLDRLVDNIGDVLRAKARRYAWDPNRSPFPGLRSFGAEDAGVFFGRDEIVDQIVALTSPESQIEDDSMLLLQGTSGVGKSSILGAGVIPALMDLHLEEGPTWVALGPLRPGTTPFAELALAVEQFHVRAGAVAQLNMNVSALASHLRQDPTSLRTLLRSAGSRLDPPADNVVVVIDQAEELVGVAEDARLEFIATLRATTEAGSRCKVILSTRSEFVDPIFDGAGVDTILRPVVVTALTRSELPALIEGPAKRAGIGFAPGLVGRLVDETANGRALPLLAYCLRELHRVAEERGDTTIDESHYEIVGGVAGAIASQFDHLEEGIDTAAIVDVLLRLVEVDEDGHRRRRLVSLRSFDESDVQIIRQLQNRRLVATDDEVEQENVSITHEAIFQAWGPIDEAIERQASGLMLRRQLDRLASKWVADPVEADLLRGLRLAEAADWRTSQLAVDLSQDVADFLDASERQERRRRRTRLLAIAMFGVALATSAFFGVRQLQASARAEVAENVASARRLMQLADGTDRMDVATLHALSALAVSDDPETLAAVGRTVLRQPQLLGYLIAHDDDVRAVDFLDDGSLVSGDASGRVVMWGPDGAVLQEFADPGDGALVRSVSSSPSGEWVATGDAAGRVTVNELGPGTRSVLAGPGSGVTGHLGMVTEVEAVTDERVLSIGIDGRMILWNAASGDQLWSVQTAGEQLWGLAVDPARDMFVVTGDDGLVELRSIEDGSVLSSAGLDHRIHAAAIDPASGDVLVGGEDSTLSRFPVEGLALGPPSTLWQGEGLLWAIEAGPDGTIFFAGSDNGVWTLDPGGDLRLVHAHNRAVRGIAVSVDGERLAMGALDATISIHALRSSGLIDVLLDPDHDYVGAIDELGTVYVAGTNRVVVAMDAETRNIRQVLTGLEAEVGDIAVDGSGALMALGLTDGGGLVVDLAAGARIERRLDVGRDQTAPGVGVAISSNGSIALTGSARTVVVNPDGVEKDLDPVRVDDEPVTIQSLLWSPDGSRVYGGGGANVVVVWDVTTGRVVDQATHGPNETGSVVRLELVDDVLFTLGADQRIVRWSTDPLSPLGSAFEQHGAVANGLGASSGDTVVSVDSDGELQLWNTSTGVSLLGSVRTPLLVGRRVFDGPDDSIIVVGRGGLAVVRLGAAELLSQACALASASDVSVADLEACADPNSVTSQLRS